MHDFTHCITCMLQKAPKKKRQWIVFRDKTYKPPRVALMPLFTAACCAKPFEQLCNWPICPEQIAAYREDPGSRGGLLKSCKLLPIFPLMSPVSDLSDLHNLRSFKKLFVYAARLRRLLDTLVSEKPDPIFSSDVYPARLMILVLLPSSHDPT